MKDNNYLKWVTKNTNTIWWHDSADPQELIAGIDNGASGATTNPVLSYLSLEKNRNRWRKQIQDVPMTSRDAESRAELLMRIVLTALAETLKPQFIRSKSESGYVCAQVNPSMAGDREAMLAMARRFHTWAPNIAVKLPATAAGLDVLENSVADGITVTATVSFTLSQVIQIAERFQNAIRRASANGKEAGKCFAVIMIGRIDDYLREVARDQRVDVDESDITQAGLAICKRAYKIYQERDYEAKLLVAALRGSYHMTELLGAKLIMSIAPKYQAILTSADLPRESRIDVPVPNATISKLSKLTEFVRAYEPEGITKDEFITYGVTQRTLSQFIELGWKNLESFRLQKE